jgi:hypothetical protein
MTENHGWKSWYSMVETRRADMATSERLQIGREEKVIKR